MSAVIWLVGAMPLGACEEEAVRTMLPSEVIGSWDEPDKPRGGHTIEASWGEAVFLGLSTVIFDNPTDQRWYAPDHAIVFWPSTMEMGPIFVVTRVERIDEGVYVIEAHSSNLDGEIVTGRYAQQVVVRVHILSEASIRYVTIEGYRLPGSTDWNDVVLYRRSGPEAE